MDLSQNIANKYELKELELNSLLEITQSINNNLPEDSLYKIYTFTLRANLKLSKLLLAVKDAEGWLIKSTFGTNTEFGAVEPPEKIFTTKAILFKEDLKSTVFHEFDVAIPVYHKREILAVVFLEGVVVDAEEDQIENHLNFIQALTNIIMVAIENKKMARERLEKEVYDKELEIAQKVQQMLFPIELPEYEKFQIAAHYSPHKSVGGDYYDWMQLSEDEYVVCIADVSGKGVPAALLMSNFQASLRTLLRKTNDLQEIIKDLNIQVFESAKGENFITFFIVKINIRSGEVEYVNAGHNPPYLLNESNLHELDKGTLVLGALKDLPFLEIGQLRVSGPNHMLLYTDGLSETFNPQDEEFGADRIRNFMSYFQLNKPEQSIEFLLSKLDEFAEGRPFSDDITLLACDFHAA